MANETEKICASQVWQFRAKIQYYKMSLT